MKKLGLLLLPLFLMATAGPVIWHNQAGLAVEASSAAGSSGVLAVTFSVPFTNVPSCTCSTVGAIACYISTGATTTGVSFTATAGGSDVIDWICAGNK